MTIRTAVRVNGIDPPAIRGRRVATVMSGGNADIANIRAFAALELDQD